ncbi:MAG: coenzyme F420-0:L-glutamate ligase [Candidatus Odinarchaeota archaeon]|nr:coenzyme F420-0:L-glutamate ligase [Candidatus Odinarchaeota archaeon]
MKKIVILGVDNLPTEIKPGTDLGEAIVKAILESNEDVLEKDIIVVSQSIVSKAEGRIVNLNEIKPSKIAIQYGKRLNKDPRLVELILQESNEIVRMGQRHLITEIKLGVVCANSGIDRSNVPGKDNVTLLPRDPDASAAKIRQRIKELTGRNVAVIITDSVGRPLREGIVGIAIGTSGIPPLVDLRGRKDLYGYTLKSKIVAFADELASAALLIMGEADEGIPVAIIRGAEYQFSDETARILNRPPEKDLFR